MIRRSLPTSALMSALLVVTPMAFADSHRVDRADRDCSALPTHAQLKEALQQAQKAQNAAFGLHMWAATVNRAGVVCAVAFSGPSWGDQWPGSRLIAAQKAFTANAYSLPKLSIGTTHLYTIAQPGQFAYGIQHSNPMDPHVAYRGASRLWGQENDPLVGHRLGGFNVFGGGLALYNAQGTLVGALGTSGDSSCADHIMTWRMRHTLNLDYVPGGLGPNGTDQIAFSGQWGQPHCADPATEKTVVTGLPAARTVTRP